MKFYRVAFPLALMMIVAGCGGGGGGGNPSRAGSISGRALDAQGQPLHGAEVNLLPAGRSHLDAVASTTTDVTGHFRLENVAAGTYTLSLSVDGPNGPMDVQISVTVPAGTTIDLTVRVTQNGGFVTPGPGFGVVSGVVLNELGQPAAFVRVKAEREPNGPELVTATDASGHFILDDLTPGLWKVWADPPGPDRSDRVWIDVRVNTETQTTLRLEGGNFNDDNDDDDDDDEDND
jgi:hypothetical protein